MTKGELTPRERVLRLLAGQAVDRPACFSGMGNVTEHGLRPHNIRFAMVHSDAAAMALSAASTYKLFGFESAVVPFDLAVEAEVLGGKMNVYAHKEEILYPTLSEKPIKSADDIVIPDHLADRGRIPVVREAIRLLKEDIGGEVAVGSYVLGPFTLAGQVMDLDTVLRLPFKNPAELDRLMTALTEVIVGVARVWKEAGADYITVREMGATSDVLSPRMFKKIIKPHLQNVMAGIESPKVLHICGDTNPIIEEMVDCGVDAVSVDQRNDVAKSREKVGPRPVLLGNIDPYMVLVTGKPEDVRAAALASLKNGVSAVWPGCDIWPTVPAENMKTLVETVANYR